MAEAVAACDSIDRKTCRETARRRFSLDTTVACYFAVYERLAGIVASPPRKRGSRAGGELVVPGFPFARE
jgi:hypothetical protein